MERTLHFLPLRSEDSETQDWSLVCVCRALKQYVQSTRDIRQDTSQLFVTYHQGRQGKPAAKTTIAGWIKLCIQEAYTRSNLSPPSVTAHSTRKQSASWADMHCVSIKDICQQASWSSSSTFVKHYKLILPSSISARHADTIIKAAWKQKK